MSYISQNSPKIQYDRKIWSKNMIENNDRKNMMDILDNTPFCTRASVAAVVQKSIIIFPLSED